MGRSRWHILLSGLAIMLGITPGAKAALTPNYYFNANGSAGALGGNGGANTLVLDNNDLYVGSNTPNNTLVLGSGTSTYRNTYVGFQSGSSNNQLIIGGGSNQSLTNGLIAYYPFDGNGNDLSGNGRNLTLTNCSNTNGLFGQALSVSTTHGGAFYANTSAPRTTNLTFSAWINPSQLAQNPSEWMYLISGSATDSVFLRLGVRNI